MAGSETRQRPRLLQVRLTEAEAARIRDLADQAGLATGSYARERLLAGQPARAVRQPPVARVELAQLLALAGRIAQAVRDLSGSADGAVDPVLLALALEDLRQLRDAVIRALSRRP